MSKKALPAHRCISLLLVIIVISSVLFYASAEETVWTEYASESVSANEQGTYLISSAEDLAWVARMTNEGTNWSSGKSFLLTKDISLSAHDWVPIGIGSTDTVRFRGSFDGNGYTISGLKINSSTSSGVHLGLFGYIYNDASIADINIKESSIALDSTSTANAGFVAGLSAAKIENCSAAGSISIIKTGVSNIGGVVGMSNRGVYKSISTVDIEVGDIGENSNVGGICGIAQGGSASAIADCVYKGSIESDVADTFFYIGGISGSQNSELVNCLSIGSISAASASCGGIAGILGNERGVYNSVTTCTVSGAASGSIVGTSTELTSIQLCYGTNSDSAVGDNGGNITADYTVKTESEINTETFAELLNSNFTSINDEIAAYTSSSAWSFGNGALTLAGNTAFDVSEDANETNVTIQTTVPEPSYTVTIPATLEVGEIAAASEDDPLKITEKNLNVTLSAAESLGDKEVAVYLSSAFTLTGSSGATLIYNIKNEGGSVLSDGDVAARFASPGTEVITFTIDRSQIAVADSYSGTLNFSISLE